MTNLKPENINISQFEWDNLPIQERAVLWAAYYADTIKVTEIGGNNKGKWVAKFLKLVGLNEGYSWCAAFDSECLFNAGWKMFKSAAVLEWRNWSITNKTKINTPTRGCLAYWVKGFGPTQERHIEIVIKVDGTSIHTIGGNTSDGKKGSQNDGQGVYRRVRDINDFTGYIKWWLV